MREDSVLLDSEYKVTLLAPDGQYVFDWVNKDRKTVEFSEKESDFSDYNEEVESILAEKSITVVEENYSSQNSNSQIQNNETELKQSDDIESDDIESDDQKETDKSEKIVSYIVRMSNPNERKEVTNNLRDAGNEDASDKLELSGPYKVKYKIKGDKIELFEVEDMGIGSRVK